ncbi:MAG: hypothetical protein J6Q70_03135 [Clostridia bacterium]|nr:hypothetical protein [Clostridia bacterium]
MILVALVLLFPIRMQAKDGGSVHYTALLYQVKDVHQFSDTEGKDFDEGIVVKILGYEVFNNVK